ncbi:MAG: enoyl-CoA hydratase [Dehalococcoidia bacterium]|nr:enoyl-CoA hydratase [Dehalococcoidia bacterium]
MGESKRYETLIYEVRDSVGLVTLNRPERLNAFNLEMAEDLTEILDGLERERSIRALVLTGAGRGFSSGGDVKEGGPLEAARHTWSGVDFLTFYEQTISPLMVKLKNARVPTIAAVNGVAYAHGFDFALCCDLRIASTNAAFSAFWIRLGMPPAAGTFWTLPRIVGHGRALEMMLTGRRVEAAEALEMGLLAKVVAPEDLEAEALSLARTVGEGPPVAMKMIKELTEFTSNLTFSEALRVSRSSTALSVKTQDADEALNAIRERRSPVFRGS